MIASEYPACRGLTKANSFRMRVLVQTQVRLNRSGFRSSGGLFAALGISGGQLEYLRRGCPVAATLQSHFFES